MSSNCFIHLNFASFFSESRPTYHLNKAIVGKVWSRLSTTNIYLCRGSFETQLFNQHSATRSKTHTVFTSRFNDPRQRGEAGFSTLLARLLLAQNNGRIILKDLVTPHRVGRFIPRQEGHYTQNSGAVISDSVLSPRGNAHSFQAQEVPAGVTTPAHLGIFLPCGAAVPGNVLR